MRTFTPICEYHVDGYPEAKMIEAPNGAYVLKSAYDRLAVALRYIRDGAYGEFYVEGRGDVLEQYCEEALQEKSE
jgi:hypothetical protein